MFKIWIGNTELDTHEDTYFEVNKGSVLSSNPSLLNREWSTDIELPASQRNVDFFNAQFRLNPNSRIYQGVLHFKNKALYCDFQLSAFDEEKISLLAMRSVFKYAEFKAKTVENLIDEKYPNAKDLFFLANNGDPSARTFFNNIMRWNEPDIAGNISEQIVLDTTLGEIAGDYAQIFDGSVRGLTRRLLEIRAKDEPRPVFLYQTFHFSNVSYGNVTPDITLPRYSGGGRPGLSGGANYFEIEADVVGNAMLKVRINTSDIRLNMMYYNSDTGDSGTVSRVLERNKINDIYISGKIQQSYRYNFEITPNVPMSNFSAVVEVALLFHIREENPLKHWNLFPARASENFIPSVTLHQLIVDYNLSQGNYLKMDDSGKIVAESLPSLSGSITNLEAYFVKFSKVTLRGSRVLTALRNYIQYSEDETGSYDRASLVISDNRLGQPLKGEDVFIQLCFTQKPALWANEGHSERIVRLDGMAQLASYLSKFQIYVDTFNNVLLYDVEFRNLANVPDGIFYIPQLNGLFIASEIIETTRDKTIVRCYKIER